MRYEIVGWQGDSRQARARWRVIADNCREIVNVIWQQWEAWHVSKGSDIAAQAWLADLRAWHELDKKTRGDKPKLSVKPTPPELLKHIRQVLNRRFPGVHSRVKDLLLQLTVKRMGGKDVEGKYNIWLAVLLNRQGRPNSTHEQPIPFDSANSKPLKRCGEKWDNFALQINLTRLPSDKKASPSIEDSVELKARKSGVVILERIVSGQYKFCGSSIVYHSGKRKWFALVAYNDNQDADGSALDDAKTATLHPLRDSPWALWVGGRWHWFGGRGLYIAQARKQLLTGRWFRQEGYRHAGSSNKGHGTQRALQGITRLSGGWKNFTKTANHTLTRQIVDYCVANRIGRLVYLQPMGDKRNTRFLATAGKVDGREDSTNWDWAQVATMLAYKCKMAGIHFDLRKCDASGRKKRDKKGAA